MVKTNPELIRHILALPEAELLSRELLAELEREKQARQQFRSEITDGEKAEFINGQVVLHSPVVKAHNEYMRYLLRLLEIHVENQDLGFLGVEKIMVSLSRNDYEPDICFFGREKARHFTPDQKLFPAPDLVVEVLSPSSEATDRGVKYRDYALHGVDEYWIVSPSELTVEQYLLGEEGAYELRFKGSNGLISSRALPGFAMDARAVFDRQANREAMAGLMKG